MAQITSWRRRIMGKMPVFASAVSLALALMGGEYYVDAGVSASGAGTVAAPFKTIQEAITAAEAGSTIHVAAGTYDSGSTLCADSGYARVCVKKSLTIQGAGRDKSFIVGAMGSGTGGLGTGAVRCVAIEADDVEISGFTICNGYTTGTSASSASGMGGGVYSHNKVNGFVVDCTIRNCCAANGGAIARQNADFTNEGLAAVRCLITDNRASATNKSWCDYGASLYWCIVTRHYNAGCSPIHDVPKVVNCTFDNNYAHHYFQGTGSSIYNTFAGRYTYKGGAGSDVILKNVYFSCVPESIVAAASAENCTFSGEEKQFVSPLANDLRPIPGAAVLSAGKGLHLQQIPEAYRTKDYEGTTVDPSSETIAVGAIQTPCAPASGMVYFYLPTSGTAEGDKFVFNDVTNNLHQQQFYWHATNWPSFARFQPLWANGTNEYGFAGSGVDSMERFPLMDGTYLMMPPPSGTLTLSVKRAAQTFYVDPNADAGQADGTAAHPFATLQDAADAVTSGGYAVIYAAAGRYDKGGSNIIGGLTNRVAFQGRHIRLVGVAGAENTFIVGARDPEAGDDVYGCGTHAVRCLCASASGAVQGFTLTGGRAGTGSAEADVNRSGAVLASGAAFQVLDCVVSSNVAGRAAAGHGSSSHLLFSRSKIIGNRTISTGGSGALVLASDLTSCLFVNNWSCSSVEGPVLGSGQNEQVYDSTIYSEGENGNFSGYGANSNSGTHRNSIFMGFGAYRNKEVYGIVIDQKILNSTKTTYVVGLTGTYTADKDIAGFVDAVNGDFRLLPSSPAVDYAWYGATTHAAAYRLATMSLDGVVPDFSGDGTFPAGAYRKVAPVLTVSGEGISPTLVTVEPAPGTTVSVTATLERPFLGFAVNGERQPLTGTNFTYTVPAGGLGDPVTITAVYDTHWYVDAVNGRDDGNGTASSPLRRLCDALRNQRSGDVVHVAPGTYDEGMMTNTAALSGYASDARIGIRALVNSGVTLVSDEGAATTFIVGAPDTENETAAGYGDGPKAVRCVGVCAGGTVKGFTLTGGRTYTSGVTDATCGGGALCADGTAVVEDCIISNCYALVGGGAFKGTLRRCRIIDCWAIANGNGSAARYANLFNCYVDRCRGIWTLADMYRIHSCTIGPDNTHVNGNATDTLYRMASGATVNNCLIIGRVNTHAGNGTTYSNCIFDAGLTFNVDTNFTTNNCRFVPIADFALDEDGQPAIGSSVAIDAGDATIYDAALLGDFDCDGKPRFVNGRKLDAGAFEADWKARYSKVLGQGISVTEADPAAEERDGCVYLPTGTLALDWSVASGFGKRYSFDVCVTGTGTLTVLRDGEVFATYTAASGAVTCGFTMATTRQAFTFSYTPGEGDSGGAFLSNFFYQDGTILIFR